MNKLIKAGLILPLLTILVGCDPSYNAYETLDENQGDSLVTKSQLELTTVDGGPTGTGDDCELEDRLEENLDASLHILKSEYLGNYNVRRDLSTYMDDSKVITIKESFLVERVDAQPRSYDQGVIHLEHESIIDPRDDEELNEYYSIRYRGYLNPISENFAGTYQIGLVSDDGVSLEIGGETVISNKKAHAPTFNCGANTIVLTAGQAKEFKLNYSQGPRYKVANTLMWKRVDSLSDIDNSLCGNRLNNIDQLEDNGWEIVPQDVLARDTGVCK